MIHDSTGHSKHEFNSEPIQLSLSQKDSPYSPSNPPFDGAIYWMNQVHSNSFRWITSDSDKIQENVDALITDVKGLTLAVKWADCLPILLYHPEGIIAVIHAGRRGSLSGITAEVLCELKSKTNSLNSLNIYFGPHISCDHYPISETIYYNLMAANLSQVYQYCPNPTIHIHDECTYKSNSFYSYRGGDLHERNWAFIQLRCP